MITTCSRALRTGAVAMVMLASPLVVGLASAQTLPASPTSPKGTEVHLRFNSPSKTSTVKGELLAVDSVRVWLSIRNIVTTVPRDSIQTVRVRVHKYGGSVGRGVGLVATAITTVGMAVACGSVEDASCGPFLVAWGAVGALASLISGAFMESNSWDTLLTDRWARLAAYARYPQGPPPSLTAEPYAFPLRR